jgi:hypothetical protein
LENALPKAFFVGRKLDSRRELNFQFLAVYNSTYLTSTLREPSSLVVICRVNWAEPFL